MTDLDQTTEKPRPVMPPDPPPAPPRRRLFGGKSRGVSMHDGADPPLTASEAARLARHLPDDAVPLPDDRALACRDCGQVVPEPDPDAVTYAVPNAYSFLGGDATVSTKAGHHHEEPMTSCDECTDRRALAADLATRYLADGFSHDGLRLHGEQVTGIVDAALSALAVLDSPLPDPDKIDRAVLTILTRRLGTAFPHLLWSQRFTPVRAHDAIPGTAGPRAWSHVRESTRSEIRGAFATTMQERLALSAPPVLLGPPPLPPTVAKSAVRVEIGCLFCGVSAVARPARIVAREGGREAAARDAWTAKTSVSASLIGGRPSPTMLAGYLCPPCSSALTTEGALGRGAVERALLTALDVRTLSRAATLTGLVPWGARYADAIATGHPAPPPSARPWQHLATDLDGLAARLRADDGNPAGLTPSPEAYYS